MKKIVSERNYKLFKLMKTAKSFARIESPGSTFGPTEQEGVDPRSPDADTDIEIGSDTDTMMDVERPNAPINLEGLAATYPIPENVRGWKFVSGMMDWQQITIISPSGTCVKLRPGMNIPRTNYEFTYYGRDDNRRDFAEFTPANGERFLIYYESCPNCCQEISGAGRRVPEEEAMPSPGAEVREVENKPIVDGGTKQLLPFGEIELDPAFEWHGMYDEEEKDEDTGYYEGEELLPFDYVGEAEGDLDYIRDADADLDGFLSYKEWRKYTGGN